MEKKVFCVRRAPRKRHRPSFLPSSFRPIGSVARANRSRALISLRSCRVPLYKTRSLRRLISDNGKSVEELLSMAAAAASSSSGAPQSLPSDELPIERLTNFMDVCAHM